MDLIGLADHSQQQTGPTDAREAVEQLANHASVLSDRLAAIMDTVRRSASADVDSTLDHVSLYQEAVTRLQVR